SRSSVYFGEMDPYRPTHPSPPPRQFSSPFISLYSWDNSVDSPPFAGQTGVERRDMVVARFEEAT
ncbi:MAG: hypothetical protein ABGY24_04275, partial [bacterium]